MTIRSQLFIQLLHKRRFMNKSKATEGVDISEEFFHQPSDEHWAREFWGKKPDGLVGLGIK